jgi:hypothetical protein
LVVSSCIPQWLEQVVASYTNDPQTTKLTSQLSVNPEAVSHYTLVNGVIRFKNRIWLGADKGLQLQILVAFHSRALGGHSGIPATYNKLKQYFFWSGMKAVVQSVGEDGLRKPRPRLAKLTISAHAQLRSRGEVFSIMV